jgi:hypothetical protein
MQGGSGVKDGRRGGSPWLHKRGFGSAEAREGPRRTPEGILDGAGDSPPVFVFHMRGREGAIALRRTAATRSPEALGRPDGRCRSLLGRPRRKCRLEGRFSGRLGLVMKASTIKGGVEVVVVAV